MRQFAKLSFLDVWYGHLDVESALSDFKSQLKPTGVKCTQTMVKQAHTHDSTQAPSKLTTLIDGRRQIISDPPTIVPIEELHTDIQASAMYQQIQNVLGKYKRTMESDRRHLLDQFRLVQVARKVVAVGSVGTGPWIALMQAEGTEPLFLQVKKALESGLANFCGAESVRKPGRAGRGEAAPDAGPRATSFSAGLAPPAPMRSSGTSKYASSKDQKICTPGQRPEVLRPDRPDESRGNEVVLLYVWPDVGRAHARSVTA